VKIAIITNTCYESIVPILPHLKNANNNITFISLLSQKGAGKGIFFENKELWEKEQCGIIKNVNTKGFVEDYLKEYTKDISTHAFLFKNLAFIKPENWRLIYKIVKYLKQEKFDVIHFNAESLLFYILPYFISRVKFVYTVHDPCPHSGEGHFTAKFIRTLISKRKRAKIILLSKYSKIDFLNRFPEIPIRNVYTIPLGAHEWMVKYPVKTDKIKNSVLFFGRISPYKGIEYLLKAAQYLLKENIDIQITIAGNGRFNFPIEEYNKNNHIKFLNQYISNHDLAELINMHEVVVCPYTDATQSGVIQTAFAFNKPVIATNVGALTEIIENGVNGIIVQPSNIKELALAIKSIFKDNKIKLFEENIALKKKNELSWFNIAKSHLEVYND
jgi:glycosyltransferase involved in cell wall biosynthesis